MSSTSPQAFMASLETNPSKILGVSIGDVGVRLGTYIPRSEATPFPRLSFRDLDRSARYTVLCLDFTAPYPAFPIFAPVLHWFQTDLVPSAASPASPSATGLDGTEGEVVLEVPEGRGCVASYKSPHPPPGSSPHSYGFYLYKQGEEFHATSAGGEGSEGGGGGDGEMGNWKRVRFDLGVVEGMELVAANYFTSN